MLILSPNPDTIRIAETIVARENVYVIARCAYSGRILRVSKKRNKVVNDGLNLLRDARLGLVTDLAVSHVALGSGTTAVAAGDSQLASEQFRKAITTSTAGTLGVLTDTVSVAPDEANGFTTEEIGWFVGGTGTANSGTMISRVLHTEAKTNRESLQIDREETYSEAP